MFNPQNLAAFIDNCGATGEHARLRTASHRLADAYQRSRKDVLSLAAAACGHHATAIAMRLDGNVEFALRQEALGDECLQMLRA
jgi:hypothetical protein